MASKLNNIANIDSHLYLIIVSNSIIYLIDLTKIQAKSKIRHPGNLHSLKNTKKIEFLKHNDLYKPSR